MTRRYLRHRASRRISALGLALSLGLVFGASGIIGINAVEQNTPCSEVDEIVKSTLIRVESEPLPAAHHVHEEGQPEVRHNL